MSSADAGAERRHPIGVELLEPALAQVPRAIQRRSRSPLAAARSTRSGEVPGEIEGVEPGAPEEVTLSLKAAKYALICNLPGHYKAGQYAEFAAH